MFLNISGVSRNECADMLAIKWSGAKLTEPKPFCGISKRLEDWLFESLALQRENNTRKGG